MTYICILRHLTNEQLIERQISLGIGLDQAIERGDKRQATNTRKRLWRVIDEITNRRASRQMSETEELKS